MKTLLSTPAILVAFLKSAYNWVGCKLYIGLVLLLGSSSVFASKNLGDVGNNVGDAAKGLIQGAVNVGGFVGVVMIIIAFVKGRGARQQGEGIGTYVGMAVLGAMLVSIPLIIDTLQTTLVGADQAKGDDTLRGIIK